MSELAELVALGLFGGVLGAWVGIAVARWVADREDRP